jgi:DNA-binding transcriptional MerR regulator
MKKLYYPISEISKILKEEQHILRYWEKEFDIIKPRKNRGGNRIYSPEDFEILSIIQIMLRKNKIPIKELQSLINQYPSKSALIKDKEKLLSIQITKENSPNKKFVDEKSEILDSHNSYINNNFDRLTQQEKKKILNLFDEIMELL